MSDKVNSNFLIGLGYLKSIDALVLGNTAAKLGAGRAKAGDEIAYEVGFRLLKTIGDQVNSDEPWIEVNHNCDKFDCHFAEVLNNSIKIVQTPFKPETNILDIIDN